VNSNETIVGVDGSEAGRAALRWAAAEAARMNRPLAVISAYERRLLGERYD
jgi:nucleotide-binding universal stress UspA family protein